MLRKIKIENLAVIDHLEFELESGLCVLTGETGAGKSLVVGAIELLLGARADSSKVRTGEEAALVEGLFQNGGKTTTVKRRITSGGRSYAWIDDSPVTVSELVEKTTGWADLLGQHEHQSLLDSTTHIDLLDSFAGSVEMAREFKAEFRRLEDALAQLNRLKREVERSRERSRHREFEIRELSEAKLDIDEWESINSKLARIDAAERILERANECLGALTDGNPSAIELLSLAERALADISRFASEAASVADIIDTAQTAISEAAREISNIADSVDIDPEEAEFLRGRQMMIERLTRKYGRDVAGLIDYLSEIGKSEDDIARIEEEIESRETGILRSKTHLVGIADTLRERREAAVPLLRERLQAALAPLGMESVRFEVHFDRIAEASGPVIIGDERFALLPTGSETAEFLISTNPGEDLRPLAAIVSGGELSRIMLAMKSLIRSSDFEGIAVFDEVDTGIGGEVGNAVGVELKRLAHHGQILVITHLPQIARLADLHLRVAKFEERGRTRVAIERLSGEAKREELMRMHGGEPNILITS